MQVNVEYVEIAVADAPMRTMVVSPKEGGPYPGLVFFTDIFQLSEAMRRACVRLASYGFVVAAHEFFHRREPAGTVLAQDDEGRARGLANQQATQIAEFDEDCRAVIGYLQQHPQVRADKIGAGGFCIGGHLAFRAALQPEIQGTVCFYPTWLHNGQLGVGQQAGSLEQVAQLHGELLVVFGTLDPLIPAEGREKVITALAQAGLRHEVLLFPADHGFMRDDRAVHDPECTDQAYAKAVGFYRRVLA